MLPNMNPKQMKRMMKQLGMQMDELEAEEVIIKLTDGKEVKILNPQIVKMMVQGKDMFQISGDVEDVADVTLQVREEDVEIIVEQTGVSEDAALRSLEESGGDIAKAILNLTKEE